MTAKGRVWRHILAASIFICAASVIVLLYPAEQTLVVSVSFVTPVKKVGVKAEVVKVLLPRKVEIIRGLGDGD